MTEFYIAFSKHGTYTFISARKDFNVDPNEINFSLDGISFQKAFSRTSSLRAATKLTSKEFNNNTAPAQIYAFFNKLLDLGWIVEDAAYIKLNNLKPYTKGQTAPVINTPVVEPVAPVVEPIAPVNETIIAEETNTVVQENTAQPLGIMEKVKETVSNVIQTVSNAVSGKPKAEQPLGHMQQNLMGYFNSNPNVGSTTITGLKTYLVDSMSLKVSPSDIKRTLQTLEKRNLVKLEGENVTKV